jgi:hypothetical protein
MVTVKQWMVRQNWVNDVQAYGYFSIFACPYNLESWQNVSGPFRKSNSSKPVDRLEACTIICAMSPMGKLLIVQTEILGKNNARIGFNLPDPLQGLLMNPRVAVLCFDKEWTMRM